MSFVLAVQANLKEQLAKLATSVLAFTRHPSPTKLHDLRVASRRSEAILFICQDGLSSRDCRRCVRGCKKLRALSSRSRDLDVLIASIQADSHDSKLLKALQRQSHRSQKRTIESIAKWTDKKKFTVEMSWLSAASNIPMEELVARRMIQLAARLANQAMSGSVAARDIHRWRISTKRTRYAFEFLKECGCLVDVEAVVGFLEHLQSRLGCQTDEQMRRSLLAKAFDRQVQVTERPAPGITLSDINLVLMKAIEVANWCCQQANR